MTNKNAARIVQTNNMIAQVSAMTLNGAAEIAGDADATPIIQRNIATLKLQLDGLTAAILNPPAPAPAVNIPA